MKLLRAGPLAGAVLLLATLVLTSCYEPVEVMILRQDLKPYRWVERQYQGRLYRQYYDKGVSGEYRIITYLWDPKERKWIAGIPIELADDVQAADETATGKGSTVNPEPRGAAVTVTERLYTADRYNVERIAVFDLVAGKRLATANLPHNRPVSIAGRNGVPLMYVAHQAELPGGFFPPHPPGITVFDTLTNQVVRHQALPAAIVPACCRKNLALSPDGSRLYLVNANGFNDPSSIEVYDAPALAHVASIPAQAATYREMTISPDGSLLAVVRSDSRVVLIDTLTNTVSAVLLIGSPSVPVFHPDGARIYLSRRTQIAVIDSATGTVSATIPVPGAVEINQLLISGDGADLFANDNQARKVFVIQTATNTVGQTLESSPGSVIFRTD